MINWKKKANSEAAAATEDSRQFALHQMPDKMCEDTVMTQRFLFSRNRIMRRKGKGEEEAERMRCLECVIVNYIIAAS